MCHPLTFDETVFSLFTTFLYPPAPHCRIGLAHASTRQIPSLSLTHTHTAMQEVWPSFFSLRHWRRPNTERERKRGEKEKQLFRTISSQDVRPWCLPTSEPLTAAHLTSNPPASLLPLLEGGQSGLGEGEETATAWRAAQPAAHQTHPHILSVSEEGGVKDCMISLCINLLQILVHLPRGHGITLIFFFCEPLLAVRDTTGLFCKKKLLYLKILRAEFL